MCGISLNDSVTLSEEDARIWEPPLAKASSGFLAGMGCGRHCHRSKKQPADGQVMWNSGQVIWKHPGRSYCEEGECSQFEAFCTRWKCLT